MRVPGFSAEKSLFVSTASSQIRTAEFDDPGIPMIRPQQSGITLWFGKCPPGQIPVSEWDSIPAQVIETLPGIFEARCPKGWVLEGRWECVKPRWSCIPFWLGHFHPKITL